MTWPHARSRRLVIDRPLDPGGRRYAWASIPDWVADLDMVRKFLYGTASASFFRDYPHLEDPGVCVEIDDLDIDGRIVSTHRLKIPQENRVFVAAAADSTPLPDGTHQATVVGEPDAVRDAGTLFNSGTSVDVLKFSDLFPSGKSYAYGVPDPFAGHPADPLPAGRTVSMTADEEKALASLREARDAVMRVLSVGQMWAIGSGTAAQGMFTQLRSAILARVAARAFLDKVR